MEKTELTFELSEKICEMLEDGKSAEEIRKICKVQANTFRFWIMQSVLLPTQDLAPP